MVWFPSERSKPDGWKFDIVSLVAVIGESTIERHTQLITASRLSWIPRLIPAPQTLLKTKRPERLPPVKDVEIFGVHSGTKVTELNFFADVILKIQDLEKYEFRKYEITKQPDNMLCRNASQSLVVAERGQIYKINDKKYEKDKAPNEIIIDKPFQPFSTLTIVTVASIMMTIGLFIWAALIHDGVAMIAIATMSASTSIACWANTWHPTLSSRPTSNDVPPGDIVIKTRKGAFVVVHCDEEVTRELYTCADTCRYMFEDGALQVMLGISTILLMASIIFFTNCGWTMQTAIGMAYIILNMMYWAIPFVMGDEKTWDMSLYQKKHNPEHDRVITENASYTQTLWHAIKETGSVEWVKRGGAAPNTGFWEEWLKLAQKNVDEKNFEWDAVGVKNELMNKATQAICK
ncbi:uncharacterized protein EURHEDRAFT_411861 [Aspergillus ruber CBS 135680]|uniref:Uncharacterized protein n=1 Tax=Aspergillus ruber (strain CBS 135680) TaxID=1388766 RepID=A0A017SF15_ASPRC|nr:uncharacterized protein EURHEDRAFT_411861 [Aspergillus ruber CBS 135680]EYE95583.1 hypothetical protein EURHEDRAFT_411861 [Aspergillus ruber CBS 135680]